MSIVQSASNPIVCLFGGFIFSFIYFQIYVIPPLQSTIAAREKSMQEWEKINRQERDTIATLKTISVGELKKWVASVDEQNKQFADIQRLLHKQEMALPASATNYILIVSMVMLLVIALFVYLQRDANLAAAITLENAVSLAPIDMMRSISKRKNSEKMIDIPCFVEDKINVLAITNQEYADVIISECSGKIIYFFEDKGFGILRPDGETENLTFQAKEVLSKKTNFLVPGARILFKKLDAKEGIKIVSIRQDI